MQQHFGHDQHDHHHHTLPSTGTRRHSFGHWRQTGQEHRKGANMKKSSGGGGGGGVLNPSVISATTTSDEVPQMMAPRPPPLFGSKHGRSGTGRGRRSGKYTNSHFNHY